MNPALGFGLRLHSSNFDYPDVWNTRWSCSLSLLYSRKPGFTATRLRPFARRREITARPLLVFIRVRKPCVFERRRRLGWNVRFGMKSPALLSSATTLLQISEQKV